MSTSMNTDYTDFSYWRSPLPMISATDDGDLELGELETGYDEDDEYSDSDVELPQ